MLEKRAHSTGATTWKPSGLLYISNGVSAICLGKRALRGTSEHQNGSELGTIEVNA